MSLALDRFISDGVSSSNQQFGVFSHCFEANLADTSAADFHSADLRVEEYPLELLKFKKCRSFRADLSHKLHVIMRANGGYGAAGLNRTSWALQVHRHTLNRWLRWQTVPKTRVMFERIDNAYSDACDYLVKRKLKKRQSRQCGKDTKLSSES